jgi:hypothetical protein
MIEKLFYFIIIIIVLMSDDNKINVNAVDSDDFAFQSSKDAPLDVLIIGNGPSSLMLSMCCKRIEIF